MLSKVSWELFMEILSISVWSSSIATVDAQYSSLSDEECHLGIQLLRRCSWHLITTQPGPRPGPLAWMASDQVSDVLWISGGDQFYVSCIRSGGNTGQTSNKMSNVNLNIMYPDQVKTCYCHWGSNWHFHFLNLLWGHFLLVVFLKCMYIIRFYFRSSLAH